MDNPIFSWPMYVNYSCLKRNYLNEETCFSSIKYISLETRKNYLSHENIGLSVFRSILSWFNANFFFSEGKTIFVIVHRKDLHM